MRRDGVQPCDPLLERLVQQVVAVEMKEVEEEGDDALRRHPVDARDGVLERRRAGRAPIQSASPSSTACWTGSSRTASTIPGSAGVISFRLRV